MPLRPRSFLPTILLVLVAAFLADFGNLLTDTLAPPRPRNARRERDAARSGDALMVKRRPDSIVKLTPSYADAFKAPQLGMVIFRRERGRVTGFSVSQDRVWDLRFVKQNRADRTTSQH